MGVAREPYYKYIINPYKIEFSDVLKKTYMYAFLKMLMNFQDERTPLFTACCNGCTDIVRLLLNNKDKADPSVYIADKVGNFP